MSCKLRNIQQCYLPFSLADNMHSHKQTDYSHLLPHFLPQLGKKIPWFLILYQYNVLNIYYHWQGTKYVIMYGCLLYIYILYSPFFS